MNSFSFFGRLLLPMISIRTGTFNLLAVCAALAAVIVWCVMALNNGAGTLVLGGAYGFTSGAIITLFTPCIASIVPDKTRIGTAVGQLCGVCSIAALLGTPIDGWIIRARGGGYNAAAGFSGAALMMGAILALAARFAVNRKFLAAA